MILARKLVPLPGPVSGPADFLKIAFSRTFAALALGAEKPKFLFLKREEGGWNLPG
jgi:hypothetical protein